MNHPCSSRTLHGPGFDSYGMARSVFGKFSLNLDDPILWRYLPKIGVETICRTKAEAKTVPLLVTERP